MDAGFATCHEGLRKKGYTFLYPQLFREIAVEDLTRLVSYYFPAADTTRLGFETLTRRLSEPSFYAGLLGINVPDGPCLIITNIENSSGTQLIRLIPISENDGSGIESFMHQIISVLEDKVVRLQFSVGNRNPGQPGPDRDFEELSEQLSLRLQKEINAELLRNRSAGAMKILLFLLRQLRAGDIRMDGETGRLVAALQQETDQPGRILIRANGPLLLPDIHREIALTPLQKTVFIFFLNREEGIFFKDLPLYRDELMQLYRKLSTKSSVPEMTRSIDELANPFSNSMSEKCARIKEAFVRTIDDRLARHYYVRGDRNGPKRISLDRQLISFGDPELRYRF